MASSRITALQTKLRPVAAALLLACAWLAPIGLTLVGMTGCSEEPPPPPPPPPPRAAPPPPPPPPPVDLSDILDGMDHDPRLQITPDVTVPADQRNLGRAALQLADVIARGDADALRPMLARDARAVLDELVETGQWAQQTERLEVVRVTALSASSSRVTLALQDAEGAYQLVWTGRPAGDGFQWSGVPTAEDERGRASEFDRGGSRSDGATLTPMASLTDLEIYLRLTLNEKASAEMGVEVVTEAVMAATAMQMGTTPEEVQAAFDRGREEAEAGGDALTERQVHGMITESFVAFQALGADIEIEDLVGWIAEAIDSPPQIIQAMYDNVENN
ncbi:MAG: hypothetical protein AAF138_00690 [Planctomycetota bacterium]